MTKTETADRMSKKRLVPKQLRTSKILCGKKTGIGFGVRGTPGTHGVYGRKLKKVMSGRVKAPYGKLVERKSRFYAEFFGLCLSLP